VKQMKKFLIFMMLIFCQSCADFAVQPYRETENKITSNFENFKPQKEKKDWTNDVDLDGDGKTDNLDFNFSRGGHCCYYPEITLSTTNKLIKYPFFMDGGYVMGVDNSYPDKFDIWDIDNDGLPEILMKIETYTYTFYPISKKLTKRYRFKTNYIVIEYEKGKLIVRDQKPEEIYRRERCPQNAENIEKNEELSNKKSYQSINVNGFSLSDSTNDFIAFEKGDDFYYYPEIYQVKLDKLTKFPFFIEGDVSGVNTNNPDLFDILDIDGDGLSEILMKIQTDKNRFYPIPKEWTKRYGFKTNYIVIELEKGKLRVRDQTIEERTRRKLCKKSEIEN
jgi:hypothetical protein